MRNSEFRVELSAHKFDSSFSMCNKKRYPKGYLFLLWWSCHESNYRPTMRMGIRIVLLAKNNPLDCFLNAKTSMRFDSLRNKATEKIKGTSYWKSRGRSDRSRTSAAASPCILLAWRPKFFEFRYPPTAFG